MVKNLLFFIVFLLSFKGLMALEPEKSEKKHPKRIIRMCCAFGTDIKFMGLPFFRVNKIVNLNDLGHHKYLNDEEENNGIIYSKGSGFIDIAHVRDQADWTTYIYKILKSTPKNSCFEFELGKDLGQRRLEVILSDSLSNLDLLNMAGEITYQISIWHEIASWFGPTKTPGVNEKFSSFSFEDNYSNALGIELGKKAILSSLPYNQAMDSLLMHFLVTAKACQTNEETELAMNTLAKSYWNPKKSILNKKLQKIRNFNIDFTVKPTVFENEDGKEIEINQGSKNYSNYYQLIFKPTYRFPYKKVQNTKIKDFIYPSDFESIVNYIKIKVAKLESKKG